MTSMWAQKAVIIKDGEVVELPVKINFGIKKEYKEEMKDYEAFDLMHEHDGTFTKSYGGLSRL